MESLNFKNEVLSHLRKTDESTWELTEPHLLYLDDSSATHYLEAMKNDEYSAGFHSETVEVIEKNKESILEGFTHINLIDLGPGYPDKSLPLAKEFKSKGTLSYYPVDVSPLYLKVAEEAMKNYVNSVTTIHERFEALSTSDLCP